MSYQSEMIVEENKVPQALRRSYFAEVRLH